MAGIDTMAEIIVAIKARLMARGISEENAERLAVSVWETNSEGR